MNNLVWHVTFAALLAGTAAQTCTREWMDAEFVISSVGDQDVDIATATSLGFDPSYSYFIRFTDEEKNALLKMP